MIPKTSVLNKKKKKNVSYQEQLDKHTVSVKYAGSVIVMCDSPAGMLVIYFLYYHRPPFTEGKVERKSYERIQYVGRQFFAELGISQWRSLEFWGTLLILLLMWWVRMYLHYLGQYAFLRVINIPVNRLA